MPVAVTRSQQSSLEHRGLHFNFIKQQKEGGFIPAEGEVLAALEGIMFEEGEGEIERFSPISLPFTPSKLRTLFTLDTFTISLPRLQLWGEAVEAEEAETETEIGWLAVLNIAGQLYVSQPIKTTSTKLGKVKAKTHSIINELEPITFERVEFFQSITVVPAATFELSLIPFYKITKTGKGKFIQLRLSDENPFSAVGQPRRFYSVQVTYSQEFHGNRG